MNSSINPILKIPALEAEIDRLACPPKPRRRLVYHLYDLTVRRLPSWRAGHE